jgi:hypothetical protein
MKHGGIYRNMQDTIGQNNREVDLIDMRWFNI